VKSRRFLLDVLIAVASLMALSVPMVQLGAAAHVEATQMQLKARFTEVCNVEGNLCTVKAGALAGMPFGRLLPGH
jgi:hypothetical protein